MLAEMEREGTPVAHSLKRFDVNSSFRSPLEFIPGIAGEKRLADVEGLGVVIGVEQLGGRVRAAGLWTSPVSGS
jgi:hypothetical protein